MDRFSDLIDANSEFTESFAFADMSSLPRRQLAVVTCMDCRIDTHLAFGLGPGDAHVLRNAGARASDDMIRSLVKSTHQLGVNRIAVIHHTRCGAAMIRLDELRQRVLAESGHDPVDVDFMLIDDPHQALLDDLERLRANHYLPPGTALAGFVYDVTTGHLEPIASGEVGPAPIEVIG